MPERRKKKNLKSSRHLAARKTKRVSPKKTSSQKKRASVSKKKASAAKSAVAKSTAAKEETLRVYDVNGKPVDTLKLDPLFQNGVVNTGLIYQAVLMYRAGEREGTASTKDRGHVRGGGKKPWKQKGTGQARHGSRRSPLWRGGGTTFGPMPRDYSYALPLEVKRKAVVEAVKERVANGSLFVVDQLQLAAPKTKLVANILSAFKLRKPLFLVEEKTENLMLASRNLRGVSVKTAQEVNALDMVSHRECLMTKAAYSGLVKRLTA